MNTQYNDIFDYVFGAGGYAGIAAITGDAGCVVDYSMSKEEFLGIIRGYLRDDSERDEYETLMSELDDTETQDKLYKQFKERAE